MHDIDFLPADYVCVQTMRKNDTWVRGLFVAVLAVMAVGWVQQQRSLRELRACRERASLQVKSVLSQAQAGEDLRDQLQQVHHRTHLLHGLRSHVRPTQWLAAITGALPQQTVIHEIHSEIEEEADQAENRVAPISAKSGTRPAIDPLQEDLQRLALQTPRRAIVISIRGAAKDDIEVSMLLKELQQTGLFERVQLLFTDQHPQGDRMLRSFAIRLRTRSLTNAPRTTQPVAVDDRQVSPH
jgi:hypothetical protein